MSGSSRLSRWPASALTSVAALAVLLVGVRYGTFAAADSDPYGYVSQADAMARGRLRIDQRFVRAMPWPNADLTFCPPGWRPATIDGFIVPIYSPGLPLVMSVVQRLFGRTAVFYVVPILGALTVWLTGLLGTRVDSPFAGTAAAMLVASSPAFLYQVVQPVSDVPAAFWWTLTLVLALRPSSGGALASGLAASMAILTRPNLVPLAVVPAVFVGWSSLRRFTAFAIGLVPGCLAVAALNQHLHGSPFESGYWQQAELFAWSHAASNLVRYPRWLFQTQTPFIFLGLLAPWAARARETTARSTMFLWWFAGSVFLSYLFYAPFGPNQWGYVRFLLPAYPPLLVLSVMVCAAALARGGLSSRVVAATVLVACSGLTIWQTREAVDRGAFRIRDAERRYVDVGMYIATTLPKNAIFIAAEHSGSIRYYSDRLTVRYDHLGPHRLDFAVTTLRAQGYYPYLALEEGEEQAFRDRFAPFSELARLDWPPVVQRSEPVRVRIYDPADRTRFLAGESIGTGDVDVTKKPILTRKK